MKVKCIQRSKASPICVYLFLPVCDFAYARLTSEWIVYAVDYSPRKRISSLLFADALLRAVEEVAFFVPPNYDRCLISLEEAINEITFNIFSIFSLSFRMIWYTKWINQQKCDKIKICNITIKYRISSLKRFLAYAIRYVSSLKNVNEFLEKLMV